MKRHFNAKFDIETEELICSLYLKDINNNSVHLSKLFGCKPSSILNILRYYNITPRTFSTSQIGLKTGENSGHWKGGFNIINGYKRIRHNKDYIFEHRFVMEKHLGRKLLSKEIIHHIDGDKLNNSINNLIIVSRSEHCKLHNPASN